MIFLDTHILVWILDSSKVLSQETTKIIETSDLLYSPIVVLELQYLYEIGRITAPATQIIETLEIDIGLTESTSSFSKVIKAALVESWTRDPFDRILVAHARAAGMKLLTADQHILTHQPELVVAASLQ